MSWLLITCGCAECVGWGEPEEALIEIRGPFASIDEAKDAGWSPFPERRSWRPHPQGGEIEEHGQGANWVIPTHKVARCE